MNLITPQIKDSILQELVKECSPIDIEYDEFAPKYQISSEKLQMILTQFADKGLIRLKAYIGGCFVYIKAEAHDFIYRGGFVAQEEILKSNIEKLGLELDLLAKELEPKHLDRLEKISSLSANIMSVLNLFL